MTPLVTSSAVTDWNWQNEACEVDKNDGGAASAVADLTPAIFSSK